MLEQAVRHIVVDGDSAGAIAVDGIALGDRLIAVIDTAAAGPNLASEFTVSAADEIDNTGGTDTTGMVLLVIWESYAGGKYAARIPPNGGRSNF